MNRFDLALFNFIRRFSDRNRSLNTLGFFLANTLTYLMVFGMLLFIFHAGYYDGFGRIWLALEMLLVFLLARFVVAGFLSVLICRPRPFAALGFKPLFTPLTVHSFPSGHVSALFALSCIMFVYSQPWGLAYFALSAIVGLARVFVGVHWPTDILAGILIGLGAGFLVHWLLFPALLMGLFVLAWS